MRQRLTLHHTETTPCPAKSPSLSRSCRDGIGIDRHCGSCARLARRRWRGLGKFTLRLTTHRSGATCYQALQRPPAGTLRHPAGRLRRSPVAMGHPYIRKRNAPS